MLARRRDTGTPEIVTAALMPGRRKADSVALRLPMPVSSYGTHWAGL